MGQSQSGRAQLFLFSLLESTLQAVRGWEEEETGMVFRVVGVIRVFLSRLRACFFKVCFGHKGELCLLLNRAVLRGKDGIDGGARTQGLGDVEPAQITSCDETCLGQGPCIAPSQL